MSLWRSLRIGTELTEMAFTPHCRAASAVTLRRREQTLAVSTRWRRGRRTVENWPSAVRRLTQANDIDHSVAIFPEILPKDTDVH